MKKQFLSFTLLLALSTWIAQAATVRGTVSDTAGETPPRGVVCGICRYGRQTATRRSRYGWL